MEEYKENLAELLEVESVNEEDNFESFDSWDSLTILSIIAFVDEEYGISLSANEINESKSIAGLYKFIQDKLNTNE